MESSTSLDFTSRMAYLSVFPSGGEYAPRHSNRAVRTLLKNSAVLISTPRSDVISWQGNLEETQEETKVSSATNGFINSYSRDLTKPSLDHPAAPSGK